MSTVNLLDIEKSCSLYAESVQKTLDQLLNINPTSVGTPITTHNLESKEDIYFSILFTGQIYGEFLIGINHQTALKMLKNAVPDAAIEELYNQNRSEIIETFSEIINIAAGVTLADIKKIYPDISITPPRAIEGHLTLSRYDIKRCQLIHNSGPMSCYLYVDHMKLDVAESIERKDKLIEEEKEKQAQLKLLNKAKSEFLANMSHELRTPLNGMIGMLDLLKGTSLSNLQQEQLNIICRSGDFLLSIINDILEFSKIESGKLELEKRDFILSQSVEVVCEALSNEVYNKGLNFYVDVDPELNNYFYGDETRLKQILINLIGNAIKFTPSGSITVKVKKFDIGILFSVIDTGVGIPPDKIQTIFDSFSQADVSDKRKYGGTGLGLAISKSIADAMQGQITVESVEAKGSTFKVFIPIEPSKGASFNSKKLNKNSIIKSLIQDESLSSLIKNNLAYHNVIAEHITYSDELNNQDNILIEFKNWSKIECGNKADFLNKAFKAGSKIIFLVKPNELRQLQETLSQKNIPKISYITLPFSIKKLIDIFQYVEKANSNLSSSQNNNTNTHNSSSNLLLENEKTSSGKKILLVEDVQINQVVASTMLKTLGYNVIIANNGAEAIEQFKIHRFDLILMDCQMPIMDGYEATTQIRLLEKELDYKTPIIALTANAFKETKEQCFESGMNDFVTKPFKLNDIKDAFKRALQ